MKTRETLLLCALSAALSTQAAILPGDVETALGGSVTYLDIQDTNYTRNGLTLSTNLSSGDWGFPDGSNSNLFVGSGLLDDKGESTPEIEAVISGLSANTDYTLWITMGWHDGGKGNADDFDFSWGTVSGSTTTVVLPGASGDPAPGTIVAFGDTGTNPDLSDTNNLAYQFATLTTDAGGNLTLYIDNGNDFVDASPDLYRSQIDGLAIAAVPEPAHAAALLGLAGMAFVLYRRRRS